MVLTAVNHLRGTRTALRRTALASGHDVGHARSPPGAGSLAVTPSRRGWRITTYAVVLLVLLAVIGWVSTHPKALPTTDTTVRAETPVGEPVYVGVFGTPADFDRTLHLAGVHVFATSTADVTIVPHVCHGGSVNVTTTPESFCGELGPTEDATLESGDEIVLEVVGDVPSRGRHRPGPDRLPRRPAVGHPGRRRPRRRSASWPADSAQEPAAFSSAAARSAASVISSASIASVRWNQASASSGRPASSSASA